ncbi:MAG: hypothetical protein LBQ44_02645 [Treponema sp.]|jgi:hypothetical protein|nr:hypothetical protein [Treponema sp.]
MANETANLEALATRAGFNSVVRYVKKAIEVIEESETNNVADLLSELGDEDLSGDRVGPILNILLVDKLKYKTVSANLRSTAADAVSLAKEFEKWNAVDLVVSYHHPELGLLIANPKNPEGLAGFGSLRKRELLVVYAGKGKAPADDMCQKSAELAVSLFEGAKVKAPPAFLKGNFKARAPKKAKAPAPPRAPKAEARAKSAGKGRAVSAVHPVKEAHRVAPPVVTAGAPPAVVPAGSVKMTPRYAVVVQNELFHNGNVEAWKRIINSYNAKHPELQVYIYYEGERILDINSLFKWGKVKHGSAIEFAVAGIDIKDVAKLQRYLAQGASHQFEAFLRGPISSVLRLF